jgi:hypothetical protein
MTRPSSFDTIPPAPPKKKKLPYIVFAILFVGYFLVIVTSPLAFDWGSFAIFAVFAIVIHGIAFGWLRPPGWKRRQREREAERQARKQYDDGGRGQF